MSEAVRRVKQQMLVAADEYEAAGQTLKAHALRALVYGEVVDVVREMLTRAESEIARLRGLIKQAEWANEAREGAFCPWCGSEAGGAHLGANGEDCPAFTPDGAVR